MSDMFEHFRELQRKIDEGPPRVSRLYATHKVPYGRVYRMWTARGDLIAYVNRGEIADLPRAKNPYGVDIAVSPICPPSIIGIPVVVE